MVYRGMEPKSSHLHSTSLGILGRPSPRVLIHPLLPFVLCRVLVFGNDDDDEEYLASLGCVPASVDQADFLLARGPFLIMQAPTAAQVRSNRRGELD